MEWLGFISLAIILCYSTNPAKVKRLESKVRRLVKLQIGGKEMSKIISELIGKECIIKTDEAVTCKVIDADDEWFKLNSAKTLNK